MLELTKIQIQLAWDKAMSVVHKDDTKYRQDVHGNRIFRASYGKRSKMGWEIDHSHPHPKGEIHNPQNLNAVHWKHGRESHSSYVKKTDKH